MQEKSLEGVEEEKTLAPRADDDQPCAPTDENFTENPTNGDTEVHEIT